MNLVMNAKQEHHNR